MSYRQGIDRVHFEPHSQPLQNPDFQVFLDSKPQGTLCLRGNSCETWFCQHSQQTYICRYGWMKRDPSGKPSTPSTRPQDWMPEPAILPLLWSFRVGHRDLWNFRPYRNCLFPFVEAQALIRHVLSHHTQFDSDQTPRQVRDLAWQVRDHHEGLSKILPVAGTSVLGSHLP